MKFFRRRGEESLSGDEREKFETRCLVSYSDETTFPLASGAKARTLRAPMAWKRKLSGGILGVIGFMLSPLSWWNDALVNLPLALLFAWLVGLVYRPASQPQSPSFDVAVIIGYWLTNVFGFVLMHKGAQKMMSPKDKKYSWRAILKDVGISLIYTAVIVILIKLGVLKPVTAYFSAAK